MAIVLYALTALLYCGLAYHGWAARHAQLAALAQGGGGSALLMAGASGAGEAQPPWWHLLMVGPWPATACCCTRPSFPPTT